MSAFYTNTIQPRFTQASQAVRECASNTGPYCKETASRVWTISKPVLAAAGATYVITHFARAVALVTSYGGTFVCGAFAGACIHSNKESIRNSTLLAKITLSAVAILLAAKLPLFMITAVATFILLEKFSPQIERMRLSIGRGVNSARNFIVPPPIQAPAPEPVQAPTPLASRAEQIVESFKGHTITLQQALQPNNQNFSSEQRSFLSGLAMLQPNNQNNQTSSSESSATGSDIDG